MTPQVAAKVTFDRKPQESLSHAIGIPPHSPNTAMTVLTAVEPPSDPQNEMVAGPSPVAVYRYQTLRVRSPQRVPTEPVAPTFEKLLKN